MNNKLTEKQVIFSVMPFKSPPVHFTGRMVFLPDHSLLITSGDELNIIQKGLNYGWPVITYGRDYIGSCISPFTEYANMQQPILDWTPSIALSGMAVHSSEMFKALNGDLLVSVLKFKEVRWVQMQGMKIVGQVSLFKGLGQRIRDVRVHPDGSIYILTDSDNGKLLRITQNKSV